MGGHPRKNDLMAYAEGLAGKGGALSVTIGGHIAGCGRCQAEVEGMRASLEFIHSAPQLDPSPEFTKQILLAAQNERRLLEQRRGRLALIRAAKGLSYAAGIMMVGAICFGAALSSGPGGDASIHAAIQAAGTNETGASPEMVRKAAAEVQTLAKALNFQPETPASPWELEYRRAVQALGADIEAARAALERNPGCARASRMFSAHLQRQAQTLKALYVERSL